MTRVPLVVAKPEAGETKEEFAERFATAMMAALAPYRSEPAPSEEPEEPEEPTA